MSRCCSARPRSTCGRTATASTVDVRGAAGTTTHRGAYLIGADGGRSTVRKQCGIAFEGFTWPERFVVLTTPFDFEAERGYCYRSYFADPGAWCNCFKVSADGPPGLWRTVFPTAPARERRGGAERSRRAGAAEHVFPRPLPYGRAPQSLRHPSAGGGALPPRPGAAGGRRRPCEQSDRRHGAQRRHPGRGQSGRQARPHPAWAANPSACSISTICQRRTVAVEFVQEQSIANKKRLETRDPEARKKNLDELRAMAADPERARQFLLRTSMIASQRRADSLELAAAK